MRRAPRAGALRVGVREERGRHERPGDGEDRVLYGDRQRASRHCRLNCRRAHPRCARRASGGAAELEEADEHEAEVHGRVRPQLNVRRVDHAARCWLVNVVPRVARTRMRVPRATDSTSTPMPGPTSLVSGSSGGSRGHQHEPGSGYHVRPGRGSPACNRRMKPTACQPPRSSIIPPGRRWPFGTPGDIEWASDIGRSGLRRLRPLSE